MRLPLAIGAVVVAFCSAAAAASADLPKMQTEMYASKADAVEIYVDNIKAGSGFYVGDDMFVTAAHVVDGPGRVMAKSVDGADYYGRAIFIDHVNDVAIVRGLGILSLAPVELSCKDTAPGTEIDVRGFPANMGYFHSQGIVSGAPRRIEGFWRSVWPADVTTAQGSSGGPAFGPDGTVVGMVVGGVEQMGIFIGISYFVPAKTICDVLILLDWRESE